MSQKGEKYARRMERSVDKLEQDVAAITTCLLYTSPSPRDRG